MIVRMCKYMRHGGNKYTGSYSFSFRFSSMMFITIYQQHMKSVVCQYYSLFSSASKRMTKKYL